MYSEGKKGLAWFIWTGLTFERFTATPELTAVGEPPDSLFLKATPSEGRGDMKITKQQKARTATANQLSISDGTPQHPASVPPLNQVERAISNKQCIPHIYVLQSADSTSHGRETFGEKSLPVLNMYRHSSCDYFSIITTYNSIYTALSIKAI